jgi:putative transposase
VIAWHRKGFRLFWTWKVRHRKPGRVIGTIRRECLDHVIVFNERSLYRHLRDFIEYYHRTRTHLGLQKDTPEFRPVQSTEAGRIISIPEVGGLHHRYERYAA